MEIRILGSASTTGKEKSLSFRPERVSLERKECENALLETKGLLLIPVCPFRARDTRTGLQPSRTLTFRVVAEVGWRRSTRPLSVGVRCLYILAVIFMTNLSVDFDWGRPFL